MKIQVTDKSQNGIILVHRLSWKERCERQLSKINEDLEKLVKTLRELRDISI